MLCLLFPFCYTPFSLPFASLLFHFFFLSHATNFFLLVQIYNFYFIFYFSDCFEVLIDLLKLKFYLSFLLLNSTIPYIFNSWKHPNFLCQLAFSSWWMVFCCLVLSRVQLFMTAKTAAHQAFLSLSTSQSLLQFRSTELVMPSNHLIICCLLFLLPSIYPSISVFSSELALQFCISTLSLNPILLLFYKSMSMQNYLHICLFLSSFISSSFLTFHLNHFSSSSRTYLKFYFIRYLFMINFPFWLSEGDFFHSHLLGI